MPGNKGKGRARSFVSSTEDEQGSCFPLGGILEGIAFSNVNHLQNFLLFFFTIKYKDSFSILFKAFASLRLDFLGGNLKQGKPFLALFLLRRNETPVLYHHLRLDVIIVMILPRVRVMYVRLGYGKGDEVMTSAFSS